MNLSIVVIQSIWKTHEIWVPKTKIGLQVLLMVHHLGYKK